MTLMASSLTNLRENRLENKLANPECIELKDARLSLTAAANTEH